MTTIIAVDGQNDIKFAWDSQTTWMGRAMTGVVKVFENGPVIFGVAGSARGADVLRHMSVPDRREYEPDFDNERWIVTKLVPAIIEEFRDVSAADPGQFDAETSVILSVGGEVGYLASNMSFVKDATGTYAVGSGSPYALGALSAGANPKKAVEIARDWDLYTGGEVETKTVRKPK